MYPASTDGCRLVLNVFYRSPRSGDAADCEASLCEPSLCGIPPSPEISSGYSSSADSRLGPS